MSRIGKLQIAIPSGVEIKRDEKSNIVTVKGPKYIPRNEKEA